MASLMNIDNMSAFTFPMEIWLLIFEQLCPHCCSDELPDLRLPKHQEGMSALRDLSLTCRYMKEVCRPWLYHCFYSVPSQGRASRFLRTLIAQPQLGKHVRILSLPESASRPEHMKLSMERSLGPPSHPAENEEDREVITSQDVRTWIDLSVSLGIRVPRAVTDAMSSNGGLDDALQLQQEIRATLRDWQHLLIMRLCPQITHLELPFILGPEYQRQDPPALPSLEILSCRAIFPGQELPWFLRDAPLARCLIANNIYYTSWGLTTVPSEPVTPVTSIRKLSTVVSERDLPYIFHALPHLDDIEIHLEPLRDPPGTMPADCWPASIKRNLVRLAWSSAELLSPWSPGEGLITVPPIKIFQSLEILEIDQASLLMAVKKGLNPRMSREETASQVPTTLPASLRILRISFAMKVVSLDTIVNELNALALAKKTFLRNLSMVQIDNSPRREPNSWTLEQLLEPLGVVENLIAVGIELRFGLDPDYPRSDSTGIIPLRPGTLEPHPGPHYHPWQLGDVEHW